MMLVERCERVRWWLMKVETFGPGGRTVLQSEAIATDWSVSCTKNRR